MSWEKQCSFIKKLCFLLFLTSFLPSFGLCSSPLCSLSCHPHRFFLLCQSGGCCPTASYLGGVASKVIFTSLLFFISVVLHLCVAWAVTLTGSFFFVRAEGLQPYCFLIWEGWHQRWSSSLCSTYSYALHWYWSIWHGLLALHWYWSIWHGLLGYIWIYIFVVTLLLFFGGRAVACGSNFNGQCSIPPLDKGLSYSQLQFLSKKLPWTPSPPGWVCLCTFSKEVKPVLALLLRSDLPQPIFARRGPLGKYTLWPTKTLYASCVNVPAFVETVDLRFCWWGLFRN